MMSTEYQQALYWAHAVLTDNYRPPSHPVLLMTALVLLGMLVLVLLVSMVCLPAVVKTRSRHVQEEEETDDDDSSEG